MTQAARIDKGADLHVVLGAGGGQTLNSSRRRAAVKAAIHAWALRGINAAGFGRGVQGLLLCERCRGGHGRVV